VARTIGASLLAHMQGGETTLAWGCKITRADGTVIGLTSHDVDVTISAVSYAATPGLDVAALVSAAGFAVDNTEATMLEDGVIFTREDILAGRWDGAAFELFRFNWADTTMGRDVVKVGTFGNIAPKRGAYTAELRGLRQKLQGSVINLTQPTCRNRLGDARCGVNIGTGGRTVTGSLTSVTSQQVVVDSTRAEAADFFTAGVITFTSGDNTGLSFKVKTHAGGGTLTLALPAVLPFLAGDTYSMVRGCRKRLAEDCVATFANGVNFNGEPHLPGVDQVTAPPEYSA
jgi:uncharacterized phage protein (TIGR02218 family)